MMVEVIVRELDLESDRAGAEAVDRMCEVGPSGTMSLYTDLLGDPICRVRHSPAFRMLVAETVGAKKEIVGLIRGCIKTVTCGKKIQSSSRRSNQTTTTAPNAVAPIYTKVAYILGLRVSPSHRRLGIGLKLVTKLESWFKEQGAEYAYMATDNDNEASIRLFTKRCGYSKFRTPSILVHPVFAHRLSISRHVSIVALSPSDADYLYRRRFSTTDFFPRDINSILNNNLSLGTFLAVRSDYRWSGLDEFLARPPESWAVMSVWDSKAMFRLEVRGAGRIRKGLAWTTRLMDRVLPWFRIPSVPDLFRPFGLYVMYGLFGEGPNAGGFVRALCKHAHNMARAGGCGVVATELAGCDPLRVAVPHWRRLSCAEDLWCVKRIADDYSDGEVGDWTKSAPGSTIFVDPREF